MLCPFTAFFVTVYAAAIYYILISKVVSILLKHPKGWDDCFNYIIFSCFSWLAVLLFKYFVNGAHRWLKVTKYTRCRNNILIGLFVTAVLSIEARRELIDFWEDDNLLISMTVSFFAAFYYIFIHKSSNKCKWESKTSSVYRFLQIIVLVIHFSSLFYEPFWSNLILQAALTLLCASCTLSMLSIFTGMLKLKAAPKPETGKMLKDIDLTSVESGEIQKNTELESMKVVPTAPDSGLQDSVRPSCSSCYVDYSETRLPRFLIQCGHSVCEGCANHQLEKSSGLFIGCPVCETVTVVNGPASHLPINRALME